jgi:hypothetical protein
MVFTDKGTKKQLTVVAKKLKQILYFNLIIGLLSCNPRQESLHEADRKDSFITKIDFPIENKSIETSEFDSLSVEKRVVEFESQIKLDNIRHGYKDFQLRVRIAYPLERDSIRYLIVKKRGGMWTGEIRKATGVYSKDTVSYVVISQRRNIQPIVGWDTLVSKIQRSGLLGKTMNPAKDGQYIHTPTQVTFQVATPGEFRQYNYLLPEEYESKSKEAKQLKNILDMLAREVEFKI